MNTRADNMQFRSVPLIQRRDVSAFGSTPSSSDRSSRSSRRGTRLSDVGTADFGRSRLPEGSQVSAYAGESGVVSVSRRHDRWRVVPDEPAQPVEPVRKERTSRRRPVQETAEPVSRRKFIQDYDEGPGIISGSESRRRAIVDAICFVPETIGGAVLSVGGAVASHVQARGVLITATIALVVFMLFAPLRDLYIANRRLDTLQQTYDALLAENDGIRAELDALQTREGIENIARERGYVEPGETKVLVEGYEPEETASGAAAVVADLELPDEREWYIRILDDIFGYDPAA